MLLKKEFTGLVLEGDTIKVAHVSKEGNTLHLLKLDSFSLVEKIHKNSGQASPDYQKNVMGESTAETSGSSGDVFGFEKAEENPSPERDDAPEGSVDFEELEARAKAEIEDPDLLSLDMADEAATPQSNAVLLYNILVGLDSKSANIGLNIPAGDTIFQIIRDTNFKEVKTKDLIEDLEMKLKSIYGAPKSPDYYAYKIREDGSLVLASVDEEAPLLAVANETKEFYNGKLRIKAVYPDEVALLNMVRANYQLEKLEITALLQFNEDRCRIVFMRGNEIDQVPAIINQGTASSNFLNTVFSKILFQLDTGKVSGLDRIIIANNTLGDKAIAFFQQNFPNISVQDFQFNAEKFDSGDTDSSILNAFTAAIAAAWAAAGVWDEQDAGLSFMPAYVQDRQKIFKLQWHGLLLLILIFLSIPTINYFYQKNAAKFESLSSEMESTNARINQIEPIVKSTNEISQNLTLLTTKLALLDSLSTGSKAWSTKLNLLDRGMNRIPNTWFTSMSKTQGGTFLEGYALYRNRIPAIVDLFADATLLNVSIEKIRDEDVFKFSMIVKQFVQDTSAYSPEKPQSIKQILNH